MPQFSSIFPGSLDTFVGHGSRDGIGFDIDWQPSDRPSADEIDLITDAILQIERALGGGIGVGAGLWDTDRDTGIQVEETIDDDIIRFDTAGVERMSISAAGLVTIGATTISAAQWAWLGGFDPTCLVRAYLSADQLNLVNITWTKVLLNAESFDVGLDFDLGNNRFVAPITGYYQVNATLTFKNAVADKSYAVAIYVNGASYAQTTANTSLALTYVSGSVSDIIYIPAGQFIELYAYSASGDNTVDIFGISTSTFLSIYFLGE